MPGKYQVLLEQPLPGSYLESVQYGGRDVLGQTIDVTDPSLRLSVVYRTGGGTVRGTVDKCGRGEVVLIPREPALQNGEMIRTGPCGGPGGRYEFRDVRPGTYFAVAFTESDFLQFYYGAVVDPAMIARLIERAPSVKVDAGQTSNIELTAEK